MAEARLRISVDIGSLKERAEASFTVEGLAFRRILRSGSGPCCPFRLSVMGEIAPPVRPAPAPPSRKPLALSVCPVASCRPRSTLALATAVLNGASAGALERQRVRQVQAPRSIACTTSSCRYEHAINWNSQGLQRCLRGRAHARGEIIPEW